MKTCLECIPCFFKQALEVARVVGVDENISRVIINKIAELIPSFSLEISPPEMGRIIHQLVQNITNSDDPYKELKEKSNNLAFQLYPNLKDKINCSKDKFLVAVKLAISGNIIDYGAKNSLNLEKEIEKIFFKDFEKRDEEVINFNYLEFKNDLDKVESILYLGDNAGETFFDRLLLEQLKEVYPHIKKIFYAVKEKPIINDALYEDALFCGIDEYAEIISSGTDAPGTVLKFCSSEFIEIYKKVDLIISKGQGNYEALSEENRLIYFLLKVKCVVLAKHLNCKLGNIVLKRAENAD